MLTHPRMSTGMKPHKCSVCGKLFSRKMGLTEHMMLPTGEQPFTCSHCKQRFPNRSHLKKHMLIHTGEKPYLCSICGKQCRLYSGEFNIHMMSHTGEKPHQCSVCGKHFNRSAELIQHMRIHAQDSLKPIKCSCCGKRYTCVTKLKSHTKNCHPQDFNLDRKTVHACWYCTESFSTALKLKYHCALHTGENYSSCATCVKGSLQAADIKNHIATHCHCSKDYV